MKDKIGAPNGAALIFRSYFALEIRDFKSLLVHVAVVFQLVVSGTFLVDASCKFAVSTSPQGVFPRYFAKTNREML